MTKAHRAGASTRLTLRTLFCAAALLSAAPAVFGKPNPPSSPQNPATSTTTQLAPRTSTSAPQQPELRGYIRDARVTRSYRRGLTLARSALAYRGLPYRWGGTSPRSGFDCSGLVQAVCRKWGIYLPRLAREQASVGKPIRKDQLLPGDLVFFKNTYRRGLSHVGIYVGNGWFINAAGRRWGVILSRLDDPYNKKHWYGARRLNLSRLPPVPGHRDDLPMQVLIREGAKLTPVPDAPPPPGASGITSMPPPSQLPPSLQDSQPPPSAPAAPPGATAPSR